MMVEFVVHPNRSAIGPDKAGHNGHYRLIDRAPDLPAARCVARVVLPESLAGAGDPDGSVTFEGSTWSFVVGAARSFARTYGQEPLLAPFGFRDKGRFWWWDGTNTRDSILDAADAPEHVRTYLQRLLPGAGGIELADLR